MERVVLFFLLVNFDIFALNKTRAAAADTRASDLTSTTILEGKYQTIGMDGELLVSSDGGQTWPIKMRLPTSSQQWAGVSVSATGQYQTAVDVYENASDFLAGSVWVSSDFGNTWITRNLSTSTTLASTTLATLAAVTFSLTTSAATTNTTTTTTTTTPTSTTSSSTTTTTTTTTSSALWVSVIVCATGQYQVGALSNAKLWISSDYGNTWSENNYFSTLMPLIYATFPMALSATGQFQIVGLQAQVFVSSNFGSTWTNVYEISSPLSIASITLSATGQYQTLVDLDGGIFMSSNHGILWACKNSNPQTNLFAVTMTPNGQHQIAVGTKIYVSSDFGNMWVEEQVPLEGIAIAIGVSGTGQSLVASIHVLNDTSFSHQVWTSLDFGMNWEQILVSFTEIFDVLSINQGWDVANCSSGSFILSEASMCLPCAAGTFSDTAGATSCTNCTVGTYSWNGATACSRCPAQTYSHSGAGNCTQCPPSGIANVCLPFAVGDGQYQTAVSENGQFWVSADFGQNWSITVFPNQVSPGISVLRGISVSATGQYQTAVGDEIWVSSDYGETWTETANFTYQFWDSVSISSTGQFQTAMSSGSRYSGGPGGAVYVSSDFGRTWTRTLNASSTSGSFKVAVSESGQYQAACGAEGVLSVSSDFGQTWNSINYDWFYCVSMSASGQYQTAGGTYNWVSADYGNTWVQNNAALAVDQYPFLAISVCATGQYQTGVLKYGNIWTSSDYGLSWTAKATIQNWISISVSGTGRYQTALIYEDQIWESTDYGETWSAISGSSNTWASVSLSAGTYSTAVPVSCAGGSYNIPQTILCPPCLNGTFNTQSSATSCTACSVGSSSGLGATACTACSPGTYSAVGCQSCRVGTYSLGNQGFCSSCGPGTYSYVGSSACTVAAFTEGRYQTLLLSDFSVVTSSTFGKNWTVLKSGPSQLWSSIAMSNNSQYQAAGAYQGTLHVSSDYGNSWSPQLNVQNITSCSVSSSGQYQTAVAPSAPIYVSTAYGESWYSKGEPLTWSCVAVSGGGQYQLAGVGGWVNSVPVAGSLYRSSDYGNTWTATGFEQVWSGVTVSMSGQYQTAVAGNVASSAHPALMGLVAISSDYGQTWNPISSAAMTQAWLSVSMSYSGQYQVVGGCGGQLWVSANYGKSWTNQSLSSNGIVTSVSVSGSGRYQTYVAPNAGDIYFSADFGTSWTQPHIGEWEWAAVALSGGAFDYDVIIPVPSPIKSQGRSKTGIIIGAAVGASVLLFVVVVVGLWWWRRRSENVPRPKFRLIVNREGDDDDDDDKLFNET